MRTRRALACSRTRKMSSVPSLSSITQFKSWFNTTNTKNTKRERPKHRNPDLDFQHKDTKTRRKSGRTAEGTDFPQRHNEGVRERVSVLCAFCVLCGSVPESETILHFAFCNLHSAFPALRKGRPSGRPFFYSQVASYSRTWIFFFLQISLSSLGQTVTVTSPKCALRRSSICTRP